MLIFFLISNIDIRITIYLIEDTDGFSIGRLLRRDKRGNQNPRPSVPSQSRILPSEQTSVKNSNTIAMLSGSVMLKPPV